jgi:hypothetical protein
VISTPTVPVVGKFAQASNAALLELGIVELEEGAIELEEGAAELEDAAVPSNIYLSSRNSSDDEPLNTR